MRGTCNLALAALLAACGGGDAVVVCTLEVRPSIVLTLIDQAGAPLRGVEVVYTVDGGTAQAVTCDSADCSVAHEVGGDFTMTAGKSGYESASATLTVARDVCHVITQTLTLTLRAKP